MITPPFEVSFNTINITFNDASKSMIIKFADKTTNTVKKPSDGFLTDMFFICAVGGGFTLCAGLSAVCLVLRIVCGVYDLSVCAYTHSVSFYNSMKKR